MFIFLGGDLLLATDSGLADKIKEPALRVLYRYWDEARAMAPLPRSRDINPASLPTLVSNIVLIETARKLDKFRFGLIGSSVRAYFEEERAGLTFAQLKRSTQLSESLEDYWTTFVEATPTYIALQQFGDHSPKMSYSRLLLPIGEGPESIDQILGGFVFSHVRNRPSGSLIW